MQLPFLNIAWLFFKVLWLIFFFQLSVKVPFTPAIVSAVLLLSKHTEV